MKEKIKKIIFSIVLILIGIGVGVGVFWYFPHQKGVKNCKIQCSYHTADKAWGYECGGFGRLYCRKFPTQDQCIDYCLTVK